MQYKDSNRQRHIYFIAGAERIKIGVSDGAYYRIRDIRNASPVELELIGVIYGTRDDEQRIHREFSHLRCHGEWFVDCPELRAHIDSLLSAGRVEMDEQKDHRFAINKGPRVNR